MSLTVLEGWEDAAGRMNWKSEDLPEMNTDYPVDTDIHNADTRENRASPDHLCMVRGFFCPGRNMRKGESNALKSPYNVYRNLYLFAAQCFRCLGLRDE
jgi:hypothetical protein